ncbi:hypothetical protein SteCoe_23744 [Stentor coeruleus]|uniref:Uncharacterized protein n=1 Tax=Stentor coeruleus TaxID=5963 RepID=A0A1R2BJ77_9CILI|nr:hypothetical protein SteCoe_23744 [Stentor coeruleus]
MLDKFPDIKAIKSHPAHRRIIFPKGISYAELTRKGYQIKRNNGVGLSLDFSRRILDKRKKFRLDNESEVIKVSRSPESDKYVNHSKPREWYSDLYKRIFEKEDYQKLKNTIKTAKLAKKKSYALSIEKKITKLYRKKTEALTDACIQSHSTSNTPIPGIIQKKSPKPSIKYMPTEFKRTNIKEVIIDPLDKKSAKREKEQKLWLEESKKDFRECIEHISEKEKQIHENLINSLEKSKEQSLYLDIEYEKRIKNIEKQKIIFVNDYFDSLTEIKNISESSDLIDNSIKISKNTQS